MARTHQYFGLSIPRSCPVVLSIFLMACSQVGTIKSMGIYLEDISRSLGTTSTDIGVALGLFTAFSYFPAPLITALYNLKSFRRVVLISGAVLISLGVILTAFASNNVLIAAYLAISGAGHCMLTISSAIALDQLANTQNFSILFGVGMSGFGVGMVLFPFLADILGQAYGWRGGLLILGGLMANLVPCAVAIRVEPTAARNPASDNAKDGDDIKGSSTSVEGCSTECLLTEEEEVTPLCLEYNHDPNARQNAHQKSCTIDPPSTSLAVDQTSRAVEQIPPKCVEKAASSDRVLDRIWAEIRKSDFYLDPVINIMYIANLVFGLVYCGWHSFLVPHAIQRGYSIRTTIIMTLCASVGNFLGRLMAGVFSGRLTNPLALFEAAMFVNALALLCDSFIHHYYVMAVTACLSAVCIAGISVLGPLAVRERASPGKFDVAYAANELFFGFGSFFGGYFSGRVAEIYSSYNATFILLAGLDLLVFFLMLPPLLIKKKEHDINTSITPSNRLLAD